jgi:hypothetical protein
MSERWIVRTEPLGGLVKADRLVVHGIFEKEATRDWSTIKE